MDSRSSSSTLASILAMLLAAATLFGCGRHAVQASEKALLSDRIMRFDDDPRSAAADRRLERSREGSAGQSEGVGCGCR